MQVYIDPLQGIDIFEYINGIRSDYIVLVVVNSEILIISIWNFRYFECLTEPRLFEKKKKKKGNEWMGQHSNHQLTENMKLKVDITVCDRLLNIIFVRYFLFYKFGVYVFFV